MRLNSNDTIQVFIHESAKADHTNFNWIYVLVAIVVLFIILLNLKKVKKVINNIRPNEYEVNLPGFNIKGNLRYNSLDQEIAWKIYVELITRVSANRLADGTGILRESLNSLYAAFGALRQTLLNTGAELATAPKDKSELTGASLLLTIMNKHLRPFLSKWHPLLQKHEGKKGKDVSQFEHEKKWELNSEFRIQLNLLQDGLEEYIQVLKYIAEGKTGDK